MRTIDSVPSYKGLSIVTVIVAACYDATATAV